MFQVPRGAYIWNDWFLQENTGLVYGALNFVIKHLNTVRALTIFSKLEIFLDRENIHYHRKQFFTILLFGGNMCRLGFIVSYFDPTFLHSLPSSFSRDVVYVCPNYSGDILFRRCFTVRIFNFFPSSILLSVQAF